MNNINNYFDEFAIFTSALDKKIQDQKELNSITAEMAKGFKTLMHITPGVTIFGSARLDENNCHYVQARQLAGMLARENITVVTGGGGGIMEAGNRGAYEANGVSVGLNIKIPHEQRLNTYTTTSCTFDYFFVRKLMFLKYARAFIVFPGGFGTMDELFEVLTLVQTKKVRSYPIILVNSPFWNGLLSWLENAYLPGGFITKDELPLIKVYDDLEEIAAFMADWFKNRKWE